MKKYGLFLVLILLTAVMASPLMAQKFAKVKAPKYKIGTEWNLYKVGFQANPSSQTIPAFPDTTRYNVKVVADTVMEKAKCWKLAITEFQNGSEGVGEGYLFIEKKTLAIRGTQDDNSALVEMRLAFLQFPMQVGKTYTTDFQFRMAGLEPVTIQAEIKVLRQEKFDYYPAAELKCEEQIFVLEVSAKETFIKGGKVLLHWVPPQKGFPGGCILELIDGLNSRPAAGGEPAPRLLLDSFKL